MFGMHLRNVQLAGDVDIEELSTATDGFSGADLKLLCRDACMMPMRELMLRSSPEEIREMKERGELSLVVGMADFRRSLQNVRSSVGAVDNRKYELWTQEFGSA
jgi:SpoVK/Ycf46/Vps4 family AAA+-type ATPase